MYICNVNYNLFINQKIFTKMNATRKTSQLTIKQQLQQHGYLKNNHAKAKESTLLNLKDASLMIMGDAIYNWCQTHDDLPQDYLIPMVHTPQHLAALFKIMQDIDWYLVKQPRLIHHNSLIPADENTLSQISIIFKEPLTNVLSAFSICLTTTGCGFLFCDDLDSSYSIDNPANEHIDLRIFQELLQDKAWSKTMDQVYDAAQEFNLTMFPQNLN